MLPCFSSSSSSSFSACLAAQLSTCKFSPKNSRGIAFVSKLWANLRCWGSSGLPWCRPSTVKSRLRLCSLHVPDGGTCRRYEDSLGRPTLCRCYWWCLWVCRAVGRLGDLLVISAWMHGGRTAEHCSAGGPMVGRLMDWALIGRSAVPRSRRKEADR